MITTNVIGKDLVPAQQWFPIPERLPPMNRPVLYRTEFYQSAGLLDANGVWRTDLRGRSEPLPVLCWSALS
jgi:hypothetical protein